MEVLQASETTGALCDRDAAELHLKSISDNAEILNPLSTTGELEGGGFVCADVSSGEDNLELLRNQVNYLGMRTIACQMFDNPPLDRL